MSSIQIPLIIDLRIEDLQARLPATAVNATEAGGARQPIIDTNYSNRSGFDTQFIGIPTPIPTVRDPAIAAPRLDGNGYLLPYEHFTVIMHAQRRLALCTASNVDYSGNAKHPEAGRDYSRRGLNGFGANVRGETWLLDNRIAAHHQLENLFYDRDSGAFQKGHIVRREDVCFGSNYAQVRRGNGDTFHSTNCTPQRPDFNEASRGGIWGDFENFIASQANTEKLNLFAGPVLANGDRTFDGQGNNGPTSVKIPEKFWKVVCANDSGRLKVFAFVLEQDLSSVPLEFAPDARWIRKQVSLATLESLVALQFDPSLHAADQSPQGRSATTGGGSVPIRASDDPAGAHTPRSSPGQLQSVGNTRSRPPSEALTAGVGISQRGVFIPGKVGKTSNLTESTGSDRRLAVGKAGAARIGLTESARSSAVESVLGNDDRNLVTNTREAPWRMICSLTMDSPGGRFIGTGWLVGRKTIITAGHCVYSTGANSMGGWATSIRVGPGRNGSDFPFGTHISTRFFTNTVWLNSQDPDFDYGCIQLDAPISDDLGAFAVLSPRDEDLTDFFINVAGYPGDKANGTQMFHHRNHILRVTEKRIFYDVDTYGGQSGAPAFIYESEGGPPMVVGIHAYGTGGTPTSFGIEANSSPRITPAVAELIRSWINENP